MASPRIHRAPGVFSFHHFPLSPSGPAHSALFMEHPARPSFSQLSHNDCKNLKLVSKKKPTHVGEAAAGGTEAIHWIWAQTNALPILHFCNAYSRKLAAAPPGVNNFGGSEYPNVPARRLPVSCTKVCLAPRQQWCVSPKIHPPKPFIPPVAETDNDHRQTVQRTIRCCR